MHLISGGFKIIYDQVSHLSPRHIIRYDQNGKMDTLLRANSQEGKLEIWKEGGMLTKGEILMVFDWGRSEIVVNSGLEDVEGRMRL